MTHAQAYRSAYRESTIDHERDQGPGNLRAVTTDDELRAARANLRELFEDSEEPAAEFDERWSNEGKHWKSESQRVIDEVNQLMQRFEAATSAPRSAPRTQARQPRQARQARQARPSGFRAPAPEHRPAHREEHCSCGASAAQSSNGPELKPDFFKKMFMFMMTELA